MDTEDEDDIFTLLDGIDQAARVDASGVGPLFADLTRPDVLISNHIHVHDHLDRGALSSGLHPRLNRQNRPQDQLYAGNYSVPEIQMATSYPAMSAGYARKLLDKNEDSSQGYKNPLHKRPMHPSDLQQPANAKYAPRLVQGTEVLSLHELPDRFRSIFSFPTFNTIQSRCFHAVYNADDNFVLSSPTGSGKTTIFELAICRLVLKYPSGQFKAVYQAPTKALCSERHRDWRVKFRTLGLQCLELTGDTSHIQQRGIQQASIIITTPEKWDNITRKWKDHIRLVKMIKLFLVDEVHMLKDVRGAILEAVVSRMKSIASEVRFIAVSATVPNSEDIAAWLGRNHKHPTQAAREERFGEEFRPVQLQKHVIGYSCSSPDFAFEKTLDAKLPGVMSTYSQRKPSMIFCCTRQSCETTAETLATYWSGLNPSKRPWQASRGHVVVGNKDLRDCIETGVAWHHAGLTLEDRNAIEQSFLKGTIHVICCTSTLAVGINLPCHLVIIKNTVAWAGEEGWKEYSELEVMQMLGRAGRPQYDSSAVAVILTRQEKVRNYEMMTSGRQMLESRLHQYLIDHLNAEINLGTVTSLSTAKRWLKSTFLYVRLQRNPGYYQLKDGAITASVDARLESICCNDIELLRQHGMVSGETKLIATSLGEAMARYHVQFGTAKAFLNLPERAKISEILSVISQAAEFRDIRFRPSEKPSFRRFNQSGHIRFPIPVNLDQSAHKVSLIIQSQLCGFAISGDEEDTSGPDNPNKDGPSRLQLQTDTALIFKYVHRLVRCIIDFKLSLEDSLSLHNALFLCRSLESRCWDDSPMQLTQLNQIGPISVRKFATAGIRTIEALGETEPHRIDTILRKNHPFGHILVTEAQNFPKPRVSLELIGKPTIKAGYGASIKLKAEVGFFKPLLQPHHHGKPLYVVLMAETSDGKCVHFIRTSANKVEKDQYIKFSVLLTSPSQTVTCHIMCDGLAGTLASVSLRPPIPLTAWPKEADPTIPQPELTGERHILPVRDHAILSAEFDDGCLGDEDLINALPDQEFRDVESYRRPRQARVDQMPVFLTALPLRSMQLPNGRGSCNHRCKDKQKCKHLCCREGIKKTSKVPRLPRHKVGDVNFESKRTSLETSQARLQHHLSSTAESTLIGTGFQTLDMTKRSHLSAGHLDALSSSRLSHEHKRKTPQSVNVEHSTLESPCRSPPEHRDPAVVSLKEGIVEEQELLTGSIDVLSHSDSLLQQVMIGLADAQELREETLKGASVQSVYHSQHLARVPGLFPRHRNRDDSGAGSEHRRKRAKLEIDPWIWEEFGPYIEICEQ